MVEIIALQLLFECSAGAPSEESVVPAAKA